MATSQKAVNKYNKKTYDNFNVRLKPELFQRIDSYCKENKLSHHNSYSLPLIN